MFGRKKKVKRPVPGSPVVVVEEAAHKEEAEAALRHNAEAALRHNAELEEANIDKTVADSFPASDPPSSMPETPESSEQRPEEKKVA
jgi:hypothetical protein